MVHLYQLLEDLTSGVILVILLVRIVLVLLQKVLHNQGLGGVTEFLSFGLINKDTVVGALVVTGGGNPFASAIGMVDAEWKRLKSLEKCLHTKRPYRI